jgi:hypothetical protein
VNETPKPGTPLPWTLNFPPKGLRWIAGPAKEEAGCWTGQHVLAADKGAKVEDLNYAVHAANTLPELEARTASLEASIRLIESLASDDGYTADSRFRQILKVANQSKQKGA